VPINTSDKTKDGNKRMERQSKGLRGLEAYCKGGQGPPRAVVPSKKKKIKPNILLLFKNMYVTEYGSH